MKSYEKYSKKLKNILLNKKEIEKSNIFSFLKKEFKDEFKNDNIFYSNITSMCLKTKPNQIRIRNDKFLACAKEQKLSFLFSGIKINNNNFIFTFISKCFYNYNHSIKSSNSFINFSYEEMIDFISNGDNVIIKNLTKPSMYIFYVSDNNDFNETKIINFLNEIEKNDFNPRNPKQLKKFAPPIPIKNKLIARLRYKELCARIIDNNLCPCGKNINVNYLKENNLNYTDIHHFAPKELMIRKMNDFVNWNIIHETINLIPLCPPCHQSIHKGKNSYNLVKNTFNSIIKCLKITNSLDLFKDFLNKNLKMSLDDLFNFYTSDNAIIYSESDVYE